MWHTTTASVGSPSALRRYLASSPTTRPCSRRMTRVNETASSSRRSWLTSSSVPSKRVEGLLELLDGGQVEVVGRLVEDQAVDAPA